MSHDDQGQAGASGRRMGSFLFGVKGASAGEGIPRKQLKVSLFMKRDQDRQDGKTEVITEPTMASGSCALQAKTTFH